MKPTDRVSDERINHLILWLEEPVIQPSRSFKDILKALIELRERRAQDAEREKA